MKTKAAYSSSHRQLLYPERDGAGFFFLNYHVHTSCGNNPGSLSILMKQSNCTSDHTPLSLETRQRALRVKSPLHHTSTWHGTWLCRGTTFCMNRTLIIMHKSSGFHNEEHLNKKNKCGRTSVGYGSLQ